MVLVIHNPSPITAVHQHCSLVLAKPNTSRTTVSNIERKFICKSRSPRESWFPTAPSSRRVASLNNKKVTHEGIWEPRKKLSDEPTQGHNTCVIDAYMTCYLHHKITNRSMETRVVIITLHKNRTIHIKPSNKSVYATKKKGGGRGDNNKKKNANTK